MDAKYPFVMPDDWLCCVKEFHGEIIIVTKAHVGDFIQFFCMVLSPDLKRGTGETCRRHKTDPPLVWDIERARDRTFRFHEEDPCNAEFFSKAYYREIHADFARCLDAGNPDQNYMSLSQYTVVSATKYEVR